MPKVDEKQLWQICEAGLSAVGYELVELEHLRDQHGWVLRIFIDHVNGDGGTEERADGSRGGVSHGDCVAASRHLSTLLDVEDPIGTAYRLEVSSPGVRRPVRKVRDFEKFVGRSVQVQMKDAVDGRRNFAGRLSGVSDGVITVEVDGRSYSLPLAGLHRARLDEELPTS